MFYSVAGSDAGYVYLEEPRLETEKKSLKNYGRVAGPMEPNTVRHPRGRHLQPKTEKPKTNKQGQVERLVRNYTTGAVNEAEFRKQLRKQGVQTDPKLDKLISKHEAGDFISHKEFGKEALRRVVEPTKYNHTNKINLLNPSYVVKEARGVDPVSFTEEIKQSSHEDTYVPKANMRMLHENTQNREIFGKRVYLGQKGKGNPMVQQQFLSSDPNIIKWEKGSSKYNMEEQHKPAKKIIYNERDHHKLYSQHGQRVDVPSQPSTVHRSSYSGHQAARTNYNISNPLFG